MVGVKVKCATGDVPPHASPEKQQGPVASCGWPFVRQALDWGDVLDPAPRSKTDATDATSGQGAVSNRRTSGAPAW